MVPLIDPCTRSQRKKTVVFGAGTVWYGNAGPSHGKTIVQSLRCCDFTTQWRNSLKPPRSQSLGTCANYSLSARLGTAFAISYTDVATKQIPPDTS